MIKYGSIGSLFLIFVFLPINIYLVIIIGVLAYHFLRRYRRIPVPLLRPVVPLILMIVLGLIFTNADEAYDILKDAWYVGKVILIALAGIFIGYSTLPGGRWLHLTVQWSSLAATIQLALYVVELGSAGAISASLGSLLLIPFFLTATQPEPITRVSFRWILTVPILVVAGLSESRTMLILLFLSWLGARGMFQSGVKTVFTALALIVSLNIITLILPQYDITNITFLGKIQNSLNELAFVRTNDIITISSNWRGFEAERAFQMWQSASLFEQVFGHGLGALIDIGFYFELSTEYSVRYLPVLHNAYFTVLVKFGVLGVGLFIVFMTMPFRLAEITNDPNSVFAARLGRTTAAALVITTLVISGPLNRSVVDSVTLLWGWSIGMQLQRHFNLRHALQAASGSSSLTNRSAEV